MQDNAQPITSTGKNDVQPEAKPRQSATRRVRFIAAIIVFALVCVAGRMWWRSQYFVTTDNAYLSAHVHPVSSRIAGVVTKVLVEDNQWVGAGDIIAEFDPADQLVRLEQIRAQIAANSSQTLQAEAQIAQSRAQASVSVAQIAQAEAQLMHARQDAERYRSLFTTQMKAVAKSELDAANATYADAVANLTAKNDSSGAARAQIAVAASARDTLKAQKKVLEAQLKEAELQLAYNQILAPVSGRVGKRTLEIGARVQPGQLLLAIVQDNVWIVANFKETQLAGLRPGQSVRVSIDAFPDKVLNGRVDSFAPASGAQFSLLPADNATGNFTRIVQRVPVKIVLQPDEIKSLPNPLVPGMSSQVEIDLRQSGTDERVAAR